MRMRYWGTQFSAPRLSDREMYSSNLSINRADGSESPFFICRAVFGYF